MTESHRPSADLLETILAATRRTTEIRREREGLAALEQRASRRAPVSGRFLAAITHPDRVNVIAECKRRSPSKGVLPPAHQPYDPSAIAAGYAAGGAAAISVLTEPTFFDGALEHLEAVRQHVTVPLLRKDFIASEYQLLEARAAGADAVLLIVAAFSPGELTALHARAVSLGLDVLVEVHGLSELRPAIDAGARIIGVNNRNLRTLEVDVRASETVIARMPSDIVAVSESGLRTAEDLIRLGRLGYGAFLMGERFMTTPDPGAALKELLAQCS